MSVEPNAGGRRADDPPGLVVPLREYLEDKIASSHNALDAKIESVNAELARGNAQSSREHAEVRTAISELHTAVDRLVADDNRHQGSLDTKGKLWRIALALIGASASMTAIAAGVNALLG